MKNIKITRSVLLLLILFLCKFNALAQDKEIRHQGVVYELCFASKTAEVVQNPSKYSSRYSYPEYSGHITIPPSITYAGESYTVTSIGRDAFNDCSKLLSVNIPNTVTKIADHAFSECPELTDINIPNSVKEINAAQFEYCKLKRPIYNNHLFVYLPKNYAGEYTIPHGIKTICDCAFADCRELTAVNIPSSITTIKDLAFSHCKKLESVTIPNSVTDIGYHIFLACDKLTETVCVNNIFVKISKDYKGSYSVPSGTTKICGGAFDLCYGLTSIHIPNSVKYIGRNAFSCCLSLQSINLPNSITTIEEFVFSGCSKLESVKLPRTVVEIKTAAFSACKNLKYVFIENPNCVIAKGALDGIFVARTESDVLKAEGGYADVSKIELNNSTYYIVKKNNSYGLTNAQGTIIIPCEMEAIESAGPGYLRYKINGFWGLMNYQAKVIIDTDRGYTSIGDFKSFNKRFSYTMSGYKGECDETGKQLSKIKIEASEVPNTSNSSSTASSTNSNTQSNPQQKQQTIVVEHHRDPQPMQVWHQCTACYGSGTCKLCGGNGWNPYSYANGRYDRCLSCGGRGKCSYCAGQGGHYEVEYR